MSTFSSKVIKSFAWKLLEKGSLQVVAFIVTLVLARLLSPQEYGIVSLVLVFTSIALVFVQGGFNTALIQKKNAEPADYTSVLLLSVVVALALYAILFLAAPLIADLFLEEELTQVTRVISLILIFGAFNSVQVAYATKNFMFKKLFISNLIAVCMSAVVGISLAFLGFGVWALVAQQLCNQAFACIVMWFTVKWRPAREFSFARVKELFGFGGNVLAGNLLVSLFLNIRSLLIGLVADTATLGLFNRGRQFPTAIMEAVNGSLQEVMLPTFSDMQDDKDRVLKVTRKSIRSSTFLVFPLMFGLAAVAEPTVVLLLTEKWLGCVIFLQIFAVSYIFNPSQTISAQALRGIGDSRSTLKLEVIRKTIEFFLLLASIPLGAIALAVSACVAGVVGCIASAIVSKRKLGYSFRAQISDIAFPLVTGLATAGCMYLVGCFVESALFAVIIECFVGLLVYFLIACVVRPRAFEDLKSVLRR